MITRPDERDGEPLVTSAPLRVYHSLGLTPGRQEALDELYDLAMSVLRRHLSGEQVDYTLVTEARAVVSAWLKLQALNTKRAAVGFVIAKELEEDRKALRRYMVLPVAVE